MSEFRQYIYLKKNWKEFSLLCWNIIHHENVEIFFSVGRFGARADDIWFLVFYINARNPMRVIWRLKCIISVSFWFCLFCGCSCSTVPWWRCPRVTALRFVPFDCVPSVFLPVVYQIVTGSIIILYTINYQCVWRVYIYAPRAHVTYGLKWIPHNIAM